MLDTFIHKYFRVPYCLHVYEYRKVRKAHATIVFLHGIGNSGAAWRDVINYLPEGYNVISVDLLGFGQSPQPTWARYDAKTQARSVARTLLGLRRVRKMVIVGHSLGALVAVELAKTYPQLVRSLILCSPPFYIPEEHPSGLKVTSDKLLRKIYTSAHQNPKRFLQLSAFAMKYKLVQQTFNVTEANVDIYMAALEAMIINQTSYDDALHLKVPTLIFRGTLDPFVVGTNLRKLKKQNPMISVRTIAAGHEVRRQYVGAVIQAIIEAP